MSTHDSDLRRQPQQQRSQVRIEQILQAATEVFWEKGYDATTTHDIAERAQTAVGNLYRFFPNKLAIFHVLERDHKAYLDRVMPQLMTPQAFQAPLAIVIRKILQTYESYFEDLAPRIVYIQYFLTPNICAYFDDSFDQATISGFAELLRSRNPTLPLAQRQLISQVFLRTYQALLLVALRSDDAQREQLYREIEVVLINYLDPYVGDAIWSKFVDRPSPKPEAIQAQVETLTQQHQLNLRQQVAIAHVLNHGSLTIQTLEMLCPKPSRRTLQRDLKQLVAKQILVSEGETNKLIYRLPP
ncbi:TetR/AcrR family transcriptional regulator [Romeriopsis navalis]|uniref:TetR/AcrR family transcriptional regulator n=1 Tax=Romeriopsis navalis TaxID=2992132 RepID=UPI0021F8C422|nr:TetR/AcrR family transcriptional regulator [Romeriopsis navalis]